MSGRADEGSVKVFFPGHHLSLLTVPPLLEGVGSFMSVDSATSPLASRRMTGGREHTVKMAGLGLEEPKKGVWHYGYRFFIDARYIVFC